jgi:hypothetical protein
MRFIDLDVELDAVIHAHDLSRAAQLSEPEPPARRLTTPQ